MSDGAVVRFLPGVPGLGLAPEVRNANAYPDTAIDLLKVMRSYGADVEFSQPRDQRVDVSHRDADIWLPIVSFVGDAGLNVSLGILASAIYDLFKRRRNRAADPDDGRPDTNLHLEIRYMNSAGEHQVRLDGPPADVIEAIRRLSGENPDE